MIQTLISYNTLLEMDPKDMNVDQIFQANMIKQREQKKYEEMNQAARPAGEAEAENFEGGKDENIDDLIRDLDKQYDNKNKTGSQMENLKNKTADSSAMKIEKYL